MNKNEVSVMIWRVFGRNCSVREKKCGLLLLESYLWQQISAMSKPIKVEKNHVSKMAITPGMKPLRPVMIGNEKSPAPIAHAGMSIAIDIKDDKANIIKYNLMK